MSVFYIVLSVIFGLMLIGGIFYISFLMETMKQKKAIRKNKATNRIQKYQRFLDCFQDGVLPKEVKLVLIEEILYNLKSIEKIDPHDAKTLRLLEEAEQQHYSIAKTKDTPPLVPRVPDLQGAKEVQLQFKNLFRLLSYIGKTRKVHTKVINKNLKILQTLFVETGVGVHRQIAEAAVTQGKTKLSLYHLNQAIGEYARADSKKFSRQIKELRSMTASVEQKIKSSKAEQPTLKKKQEDKKKDRGLNRMFDESAEMSAKRNMR